MPVYTVQPGDYLVKIARNHGIANWHTIWDHPANTELRQQRKSPDILQAGDKLFVPAATVKTVELATGKTHKLAVSVPRPRLRIRVLDVNGNPVANQFCFVSIDTPLPATTDSDGKIDVPLEPDHPVEGELFFPDLKLKYHLMIGGLDPENTEKGEKHRLNNMGYFAGVHEDDQPGDADDWQLRWAKEEFERDHGVKHPAFDKFDPDKLAKEHGS
jgi:hypothetical protein